MEDFECTSCFSELGLIRGSTIKVCTLDPLPASIMRQCYPSIVPVFRRVINLSLSSGLLPKEFKVALLLPLLKADLHGTTLSHTTSLDRPTT